MALAIVALRPADREVDGEAHGHAEAACDLTSKAQEAARVDTGARTAGPWQDALDTALAACRDEFMD